MLLLELKNVHFFYLTETTNSENQKNEIFYTINEEIQMFFPYFD